MDSVCPGMAGHSVPPRPAAGCPHHSEVLRWTSGLDSVQTKWVTSGISGRPELTQATGSTCDLCREATS